MQICTCNYSCECTFYVQISFLGGVARKCHVITHVNALSHLQIPHFHASQSTGMGGKIPFTLVKSRCCVCFGEILACSVMARLLSKLRKRRAFSAPNVQTVFLSLCYCYGVNLACTPKDKVMNNCILCSEVGRGNSVRWVTPYTSYSELCISGTK